MSNIRIKALKPFTIRDNSTGALTSIGCGQVAEFEEITGSQLIADGLADLYTLISPSGTKNITANGEHDVASFATANVVVEPTLEVSVVPVDGSEVLFGKSVSDLQSSVAIANNAITGNLNYIVDYTEFSSNPSEQSGHYLAIKCEALAGSTITVELINGTLGHPVTLDSDGMIVIRITNTGTQSVQVVATKNHVSQTVNLSISNLVLLPQEN